MKILYLCNNEINYMNQNRHFERIALSNYNDVIYYGEGWPDFDPKERDIQKIIKRLYKKHHPDLIIHAEGDLAGKFKNLNKIKISKATTVCLPRYIERDLKFIKNNKFNIIFFRYPIKKHWDLFIKKFNIISFYMPWSINTNRFKDYNLEKKYDISLFGSFEEELYPFRCKVHNILTNQKNINYFHPPHPSYFHRIGKPKKDSFFGDNYAKELNKSKMSFTDGTVFKVPLAKYFEIPAVNSLLVAENIPFLEELGFIEDKHIIVIDNGKEIIKKINYYLENEKERKKIAKAGFDLINKRHINEIRAKEVTKFLEKNL